MDKCINCGNRAFFREKDNDKKTFCSKECQRIDGEYMNNVKGGLLELQKMIKDYVKTKNKKDKMLMRYILEDLGRTAMWACDNTPGSAWIYQMDQQIANDKIDLQKFQNLLLKTAWAFGIKLPSPFKYVWDD